MELLVINPNTTDAITEIIRRRAVAVAAPGTEINAVTAPFGADYITTPEQGAVAVDAMRQLISERRASTDAAVICSSSDSGLEALRAEFDMPIMAMTESSLRAGAMLGTACAIMVYFKIGIDGMKARARDYGMGGFVKSVRVPIEFDGGIPPDEAAFRQAVIDESRRAIEADGVDVIIPGGSAAANLTEELSRATGVQVIEGISCAVKMAEALAGLRTTGLANG